MSSRQLPVLPIPWQGGRRAVWVVVWCLAASLGAAELSAQKKTDWVGELSAFLDDVEANYPFFEVKGIRKDWDDKRKTWLAGAKTTKDEVAFVRLAGDVLGCLRDGHAFFTAVRPKMPDPEPEFGPQLALMPATGNRVVVMASGRSLQSKLPVGTVVTHIDGKGAREVLDAVGSEDWRRGGKYSSPRWARFFAYRTPLRAARGEKHVLTVLDGKTAKRVDVTADTEIKGFEHAYNLPAGIQTAAKSVFHAAVADGRVAYVWLRRIDDTVTTGLAAAIAAHPDVKGTIVDLRGNSGGGYDDALIEAIKQVRGSVAVLLDPGCISAGETVARDFKKERNATLFGETTAGSSTQKRTFAFPSGVAALQYSVRSRFGPGGIAIEFNGVAPDVALEADPDEVRAGKNTEIERATEWILKQGG